MIASLCSRLDEAELEVQASNLNVEKVHEELHNLQCQVATFLIHIESLSSSLEDELIFDQVEDMSSSTEANVSIHLKNMITFFRFGLVRHHQSFHIQH
jgi:hypothetical protein